MGYDLLAVLGYSGSGYTAITDNCLASVQTGSRSTAAFD